MEPAKKKSVFAVINPVAGNVDGQTRLNEYRKYFEGNGWEFEYYFTTGNENLAQIVKDAVNKGVDLVMASGGDGTVSQVAGGVAGLPVPLAIFPCGTGNFLAHDLGITSPERALSLLEEDYVLHAIDLMRVGSNYHGLNLSVGLSAQAMDTIKRQQKKRFGMLAYVWNVVINLSGVRLNRFDIWADDLHLRLRASEVMVANSSLIGLTHLRDKIEVRADDGTLDIFVLRARTLVDWIMVLANGLFGVRERNPRFRSLIAQKSIRVSVEPQLLVQADGDVIGTTPVEVKIIPGAVRVITPKERKFPVREMVQQLSRLAGTRE